MSTLAISACNKSSTHYFNEMEKKPAIYIMASKRNGTLYTGVTGNLSHRVYQHRDSVVKGFTKHYHCHLLVYYEYHNTMRDAIKREKQIKAGSRADKLKLINQFNPIWRDLYEHVI